MTIRPHHEFPTADLVVTLPRGQASVDFTPLGDTGVRTIVMPHLPGFDVMSDPLTISVNVEGRQRYHADLRALYFEAHREAGATPIENLTFSKDERVTFWLLDAADQPRPAPVDLHLHLRCVYRLR